MLAIHKYTRYTGEQPTIDQQFIIHFNRCNVGEQTNNGTNQSNGFVRRVNLIFGGRLKMISDQRTELFNIVF